MVLRTRSKSVKQEEEHAEDDDDDTDVVVARNHSDAPTAASASPIRDDFSRRQQFHFQPPSNPASSRRARESRTLSPSRQRRTRSPRRDNAQPDADHDAAEAQQRVPATRPRADAPNAPSSGARSSPPPNYQRGTPLHPGTRPYHMSSRDYHHVSSELDAAKDDFGPSIVDCINMGSFAEEESPPRYRRKQGASPPYQYGAYPPFRSPAGYPPPPPHGYYQAYPGYYASRGGYPLPPPPPEQHWSSPSAYEYGDAPPTASPPTKKARWAQSTPEKKSTGPSPFRSPPDEEHKFKKSPLFHGTPSIGGYGSFGVDTPGGSGHLGEFSPMGPSFANFDGPLVNLQLSKSSSGDESSGKPVISQRRAPEEEYAENLLGGVLSPFVGNIRIQGSPLRGGGRSAKPPPSLPSSLKKSDAKSRFSFASPVGSSASEHKESPWFHSGTKMPGPVRLELGDMTTKRDETRKGLEGINSMLRGDNTARHITPASSHRPRQQPPPPPHQQGSSMRHPSEVSRGSTYPPRGILETPVKNPHAIPLSGHRGTMPYPLSASSSQKLMTSGSEMRYHPPGSASRKSPRSGKENATPKNCNCKKSNCLKLYCVCFAAELYCDGCNCNDCRNTKDYEDSRIKAMKDCRNKNPNAFKSKIDHSRIVVLGPPGASPQSIHNMGCKCKKSECLKKYCECFQNGVMCGSKCKCVDCLNFGGSQALIDKRRKIKDHRGAEIAMRVADEAWKGKHAPPLSTAPLRQAQSPSQASRRPPPHALNPHPMMRPSPSGHSRGPPSHYMPSHYMAPPIGYSPMGAPHGTPKYMHGKLMMHGRHSDGRPTSHPPPYTDPRRPRMAGTPKTPKTPAVRLSFDPNTSKKKRKLQPGTHEQTFPYFDALPEQPKTTALTIFSFLSNDEMYNAGLVCKRWSRLAIDEELWELPQF